MGENLEYRCRLFNTRKENGVLAVIPVNTVEASLDQIEDILEKVYNNNRGFVLLEDPAKRTSTERRYQIFTAHSFDADTNSTVDSVKENIATGNYGYINLKYWESDRTTGKLKDTLPDSDFAVTFNVQTKIVQKIMIYINRINTPNDDLHSREEKERFLRYIAKNLDDVYVHKKK